MTSAFKTLARSLRITSEVGLEQVLQVKSIVIVMFTMTMMMMMMATYVCVCCDIDCSAGLILNLKRTTLVTTVGAAAAASAAAATCAALDACREGLAAIVGKRKPDFCKA